jgi:hypothetical protein
MVRPAHHGLSLLITAQAGKEKHSVLFDAGPASISSSRASTIPQQDAGNMFTLRDIVSHVAARTNERTT